MPTYIYREDSGYDQRFASDDDTQAENYALMLLDEGDWGQSVTKESIRVRASFGRVADDSEDGTDVAEWRTVTQQYDPSEPRCPGRSEHDWQAGQAYGSDHGGVRWTDTCGHCEMKRTTDTGATDRANGEQMTSVSYERAEEYA